MPLSRRWGSLSEKTGGGTPNGSYEVGFPWHEVSYSIAKLALEAMHSGLPCSPRSGSPLGHFASRKARFFYSVPNAKFCPLVFYVCPCAPLAGGELWTGGSGAIFQG